MRQRSTVVTLAFATLIAGCADSATFAPEQPTVDAQFSAVGGDVARALATLRRVTAPYHNLDKAIADGFIPFHPCEERDEGPVGALYVHIGNLLDGVVDPEKPDALLYEPARNGKHKLVGVEFAVLKLPDSDPPSFLGNEFHDEDEFGVWALHVWLWRHNPDGMFAEANQNVSCDAA